VSAEEMILNLLKEKGSVLQSEIPKLLRLSKSTVSEVLKKLENRGLVIREKIAGKSYRVWYFEFAPKPCKILRVGILRASEYPHVLLALKDLNVDYHVKVFDSALSLTKALASCQIDIGFSPFVTQTVFALLLKSIKIHRIIALNGSGLVFKKKLKDCKTFATSEFSAMEANLKLLLESLGFVIYDFSFRYFSSVDQAIKSFKSCEFDAIAVWEPHFTMLNGEKLPFKDVIGDYPCCSMASNVEFYKINRDLIRDFVSCLENSTEELKKSVVRQKASKLLAKLIGFSPKTILKSFDSYKFVCRLNRDDFRFLNRYGFKLTEENIKSVYGEV
jgi:predicted transcriptional regulator